MFDMTTYSIVLLVHVGAAAVLVGSSLFAPLVHRAMRTAGSYGALRMWLAFAHTSSRANPAAALLVLGTGVYLGSTGWWTQPWFHVALAAWVANSVLAGAVVKRTAAALAAAISVQEGTIDGNVDALRQSRAWPLADAVMRASDVTMLYVMFVKPPLADCSLVLAAAIVLSVAAERRASRRSKAATPGRAAGSTEDALVPAVGATAR